MRTPGRSRRSGVTVLAVAAAVLMAPLPIEPSAAAAIAAEQPGRAPTTTQELCAMMTPGPGDRVVPQERGNAGLRQWGAGTIIACVLWKDGGFDNMIALSLNSSPEAACAEVTEGIKASQMLGVPPQPLDFGDRGFDTRPGGGNPYNLTVCRGAYNIQGNLFMQTTDSAIADMLARARQIDQRCRGGATTSRSMPFEFNLYAYNVKALPPLRFDFQLGLATLTGGGLMRDGKFTGTLTDYDIQLGTGTLRWMTAEIQPMGTYEEDRSARRLKLRVKVLGSSDPMECPPGAIGTLELQDSPAKMSNGQDYDYAIIEGWAPKCDPHGHGWNNEDPGPRTSPPTGGPDGGQMAVVIFGK